MSCPLCGNSKAEQLALLTVKPKAGRIRAAVLDLVKTSGPQGLTFEDVSKVLRIGTSSASARLHDLRRAGLVERKISRDEHGFQWPEKRETATGNWAGVYVAVAPELLGT